MRKAFFTALLLTACCGSVWAGKQAVQKVSAPEAERAQLARKLVLNFASDVRAKNQDVMAWASKLGRAIGAAPLANARKAAEMPTLQAAMAVLLGQPTDSKSIKDVQSAVKSGMVTAPLLGDPIGDLVYTPLPNGRCRVADSRVIAAPLASAETRGIDVETTTSYASQGGNGSSVGDGSTNCGIPDYTAALVVSVTVLPTTSSGFFKIFANDQVYTDGNTVLWSNFGAATNDVIVKSCQSCAYELSVYGSSGTHYVVDVLGYFMRPQATALDCETTSVTAQALAANTTGLATAPACSAGYAEVSAQCRLGMYTDTLVGIENGTCFARAGANASSINVSRRCCRVPGR